MRKEIDIILRAARRDCAVVEKDSNLVWSLQELEAARDSGQYQTEDRLLSPDDQVEVTGPYPGCLQLGAPASSRGYRAIGQTEHFVIFVPANQSVAWGQTRDG